MLRQRLRATRSPLALLSLLPLTLLALALIWYGGMVVLLAAKMSPGQVDKVSGYRTVYRFFAELGPVDVDPRRRRLPTGSKAPPRSPRRRRPRRR